MGCWDCWCLPGAASRHSIHGGSDDVNGHPKLGTRTVAQCRSYGQTTELLTAAISTSYIRFIFEKSIIIHMPL